MKLRWHQGKLESASPPTVRMICSLFGTAITYSLFFFFFFPAFCTFHQPVASCSALNLSYGVLHFATESHPGLRFARVSTPQGKPGLLKTRAFLYLTMLGCHVNLFPRLVTFFWGSRQEVSSVLYSIMSIYLSFTLPYLDLAQRVKNQSISPISPRVRKRVRFSFLTIISIYQ